MVLNFWRTVYNVHDYSGLYNGTVGPIICEDWSLTRMWKAPALPDNATKDDLGPLS